MAKLFLPFEKAREVARSLQLRSETDWKNYFLGLTPEQREPFKGIPRKPQNTYQSLWQGWEDWLGASYVNRNLPPMKFSEARAYARSLGLNNSNQWHFFCTGQLRLPFGKCPVGIPHYPREVYRDEWRGWQDWLGIQERYWPFEQARTFVQSLGLNNWKEWHAYCQGELKGFSPKPSLLPEFPERIYADWKGYADWFGEAELKKVA